MVVLKLILKYTYKFILDFSTCIVIKVSWSKCCIDEGKKRCTQMKLRDINMPNAYA